MSATYELLVSYINYMFTIIIYQLEKLNIKRTALFLAENAWEANIYPVLLYKYLRKSSAVNPLQSNTCLVWKT